MPGISFVFARVNVDLRVIEIRWYGIPGKQNCSRRITSNWSRKFVEHWLIAETPIVDLVCDFGDFVPRLAAVDGFEDWEVDEWGLGTIVFPCCEEHAAFELDCASVEDLWVCIVGGRNEDGDIGECRER